jgi:hypothetical protein
MLFASAAQEVSTGAASADTRNSATESPVIAEPPYYSLKQLKQWLEREKQGAQARVKALEESGAPLDPATRRKLEEGPEYAEALWDYLYVRAYPNDFVDWLAYIHAAEHRDQMTGAFFPAAGRALGVHRAAQRAPALPHLFRHGGGVGACERRRLRPRQRECLLHGRAAGRCVEDHRRRTHLAAAHRPLAVPAGRLHRRASDEPEHPVCGHGRLSGLDAPLLARNYEAPPTAGKHGSGSAQPYLATSACRTS